ncbi:MAG: UDP-4-amino-4,6-dideoxy-N-acetyl-beta-L-altrosamine transaminase [Granulosicoccus sp.]
MKIPYGRQSISDADKAAVQQVLESDWLTQGPTVPQFESALSAYCCSSFCVAVNSATSALHLSCLALGVGAGDEVWTTPNTFVASANCARFCGATVDFVDIDLTTYNLSPDALRNKLSARVRSAGKIPKVLVVVHFAGQPCDMSAISRICENYGIRIVEDASHAIGAQLGDKPIGACEFSDITVFSFHPVKIITCGEGGAVLTNDAVLHERMAQLRTHGIVRPVADHSAVDDRPWVYEQHGLGFNYRMTDIQAALGLSQLSQIDAFTEKRHVLADRYDAELADTPLQLPCRVAGSRSALHLYPVLVNAHESESSQIIEQRKLELFRYLRCQGIGVNVHYIPVHTQPYYQQFGFRFGDFPNAERYYYRTLSIPMFASLTDSEQSFVIHVLHSAYATVKLAA